MEIIQGLRKEVPNISHMTRNEIKEVIHSEIDAINPDEVWIDKNIDIYDKHFEYGLYLLYYRPIQDIKSILYFFWVDYDMGICGSPQTYSGNKYKTKCNDSWKENKICLRKNGVWLHG